MLHVSCCTFVLLLNLQDVEAQKKARAVWSQEEDEVDGEQQNAESKRRLRPPRYHKKHLDTKKDAPTKMWSKTPLKTSWGEGAWPFLRPH